MKDKAKGRRKGRRKRVEDQGNREEIRGAHLKENKT
jgi:hypothetical protein